MRLPSLASCHRSPPRAYPSARASNSASPFTYDPNPLQDFCVADTASSVFVNGLVCKDPARVSAGDFTFPGL
jgi:hypothetical protein